MPSIDDYYRAGTAVLWANYTLRNSVCEEHDFGFACFSRQSLYEMPCCVNRPLSSLTCVCMDMSIGVSTDMRTDMRIDMWTDVYRDAERHEEGLGHRET